MTGGSPGYDADAFRAFIHEGWKDAAAHYHDLFGAATAQAARPMLDAVEAGFGTRLLDLACGSGQIAAAALMRGATVTGVDFSEAMVADARRRYPGGDFRVGDAEALPFPDGAFEAVVCNFGMAHFGRPGRAIAEAGRVLSPGGRFAFTLWSNRSGHSGLVNEAIAAYGDPDVPLPKGPPRVPFAQPAERARVLGAAGFGPPTEAELPIVLHCPSAEYLLDVFYRSTVRTGRRLLAQPPAARERIDAAIVAGAGRYMQGGAIALPMPALMVSARKES